MPSRLCQEAISARNLRTAQLCLTRACKAVSREVCSSVLNQAVHEFKISTRGRGFYEFTEAVAGWINQNGFQTGLLTLHLRHTSASLLIQENADPDVRRDLEEFFARLVTGGAPLFV